MKHNNKKALQGHSEGYGGVHQYQCSQAHRFPGANTRVYRCQNEKKSLKWTGKEADDFALLFIPDHHF